MGGCFSDVKGGQEAVGGAQARRGPMNNAGGNTYNDAVDHFMRSRGLHALSTQVEVHCLIYSHSFVMVYVFHFTFTFRHVFWPFL